MTRGTVVLLQHLFGNMAALQILWAGRPEICQLSSPGPHTRPALPVNIHKRFKKLFNAILFLSYFPLFLCCNKPPMRAVVRLFKL